MSLFASRPASLFAGAARLALSTFLLRFVRFIDIVAVARVARRLHSTRLRCGSMSCARELRASRLHTASWQLRARRGSGHDCGHGAERPHAALHRSLQRASRAAASASPYIATHSAHGIHTAITARRILFTIHATAASSRRLIVIVIIIIIDRHLTGTRLLTYPHIHG